MDIKALLYDWNGGNLALFQYLHAWHGETYDRVMLLGTAIGEYEHFYLYFPIILIFAGLMIWHEKLHHKDNYVHYKRDWAQVFMVMVLSYGAVGIVITLLKEFYQFPRPFVILPEGSFRLIAPPMEEKRYYVSFPSGHAAFSMFLAAALWPVLNRLMKSMAVVFVLWVGLSRIALAEHFPADVLAGYVVSIAVVLLMRRGVEWAWQYVVEWQMEKQKL